MSDTIPDPSKVKADPKRPYKAYAATALAFLAIVASAWIADDGGVTSKEVVGWIVSGLIGAGLTGGVTYGIPNPKVVKLPYNGRTAI